MVETKQFNGQCTDERGVVYDYVVTIKPTPGWTRWEAAVTRNGEPRGNPSDLLRMQFDDPGIEAAVHKVVCSAIKSGYQMRYPP